jgi:hypothetical protein
MALVAPVAAGRVDETNGWNAAKVFSTAEVPPNRGAKRNNRDPEQCADQYTVNDSASLALRREFRFQEFDQRVLATFAHHAGVLIEAAH